MSSLSTSPPLRAPTLLTRSRCVKCLNLCRGAQVSLVTTAATVCKVSNSMITYRRGRSPTRRQDRPAAAHSNCDVVKDGAGDTDHPQTTSKAITVVFRGMPSRSSRVWQLSELNVLRHLAVVRCCQ